MGHSGDIFNTQQAGAVGPHAHAHDMNFNQIWNQSSQEISLPTLANDLAILRAALKKEATEPEHDVAIGSVAAAEKAAKEGNGAKALEHLKAAGEWALKVATSIGVPVAIEALKKVLGG